MPQIDPKMAQYLNNLDSNPNNRYIQIQHPVTKQTMVVPNPNFNPDLQVEQESSDGGLGDSDNEEDLTDKSWCSIVKNYCPESTECVWWVVPEDSEEEDGGCSQVSSILASIEAAHAKADFFKKAEKAVEALLTASNDSALASLMDKFITSIQLKNEQAFSDSPSDKKANKKDPVAKKEVIVDKDEPKAEDDQLDVEDIEETEDDQLNENLIVEDIEELDDDELDDDELDENDKE